MNNTNTLVDNNGSIINQNNISTMDYKQIILIVAAASLLAAGAFMLGRYISQSKKNVSKDSIALDEAIFNNKTETDNQNNEIKIIFQAISEFNQEAYAFNELVKKKKSISNCGLFHVVTEKTPLLETMEQQNSAQLLAALHELRTTYPKGPYYGTPLQRVESYDRDRKEHHEKILSIVAILLPDLERELREARELISQNRI